MNQLEKVEKLLQFCEAYKWTKIYFDHTVFKNKEVQLETTGTIGVVSVNSTVLPVILSSLCNNTFLKPWTQQTQIISISLPWGPGFFCVIWKSSREQMYPASPDKLCLPPIPISSSQPLEAYRTGLTQRLMTKHQ